MLCAVVWGVGCCCWTVCHVVLCATQIPTPHKNKPTKTNQNKIVPVAPRLESLLRLARLPPSVRHLAAVLPVPAVFPHLTTSEHVLRALSCLSEVPFVMALLRAVSLEHVLYSRFDGILMGVVACVCVLCV